MNTTGKIKKLIDKLRYIDELKPKGNIAIERQSFITPVYILPIATAINNKKLKVSFTGDTSYLETICFPKGISDLNSSRYLGGTYFPIVNVSLHDLSYEKSAECVDALHSKYLDLLQNNIIANKEFLKLIKKSTFGFLLGEMTTNVAEHASASNIYVFAQYWLQSNSCEICLLDNGQGVFGSLREAGREVKDSHDALDKVLKEGLSASDEHGDIKRGTGIRNTRKALVNKEINGEFFIMSGNSAFLHSSQAGERFFTLQNYSWQGTIIMLRINNPLRSFNMYKYVR